jgi:putative SOS response-associated peptidase YedK
VDGYYEWLENERETRPFFLKNKDEHGYLYLACLYNNAFTKTLGEEYNHFVVLTMDAAKYVRHIHDRMPVLLSEKTKDMWLNPDIPF